MAAGANIGHGSFLGGLELAGEEREGGVVFGLVPGQFGGKFLKRTSCSDPTTTPPGGTLRHLGRLSRMSADLC